ncbi:MAG: bifunctional demethylmenaquinone methyltransferase/2-methoxy-6-polyprenyl-1,4-benzoquinol methylase UbiE [Nitrospinae bacterium]|nr:bifunctional demethylmenaquinone methyltransferase/2-methoxy-6-polyprenyl-1,4-benzoquinol methylase UbiE [Nitrospinota bacterium]
MVEKDPAKIERMFSDIAPRYDLLNRLLSMGIDKRWRTQAIRELAPANGLYLDVATGTCDVASEIARQGNGVKIVGLDFSREMLIVGKTKISGKPIRLCRGDALKLPFAGNLFEGAACAYGIRNFADLDAGLKEICRILKPGGRIAILEFTTPSNLLVKALYLFYFTKLLPLAGRIISGHREAYSYLPASVMKFPDRHKLKTIFENAGFTEVKVTPLTFGISDLITARKP